MTKTLNMNKERKIRKIIYKQHESWNKEIVERSQTKGLKLKSAITEMKISLQGFNSRFEQAKKYISQIRCQLKLLNLKSRDRDKKYAEKRMKPKASVECIKWANTCIMGVSKRKRKV